MSIFAAARQRFESRVSEIVHFTDADGSVSGTYHPIDGLRGVLIDVQGTMTGGTLVVGARTATDATIRFPAILDASGQRIDAIRATGTYWVDLAGFHQFRVTRAGVVGSVTVRTRAQAFPPATQRSSHSVQHEAADGTISGSFFDVRGMGALMIEVDGSMTAGSIVLSGRFDQDSPNRLVPVRSAAGLWDSAAVMRAPGVYRADVTGLGLVRANLSGVTGSVTVRLRAEPLPLPDPTRRIVELARALDVTVAAESLGAVIPAFDASAYPLHFVLWRADASHKLAIEFGYRPGAPTTHGTTFDVVPVVQEEGSRGSSQWVEAKGRDMEVLVRNEDTDPHSYDVVLYGVR